MNQTPWEKKNGTNRMVGKTFDEKVIFKIRTEGWENIPIRLLAANRWYNPCDYLTKIFKERKTT